LHFGQGPSGTRPREVGRFGAIVAAAVAEIEAHLVGVVQVNRRGERLAEPAPESLQRADAPLLEQRVGFGDLELPAAHDLPEAERARLALELLVVFVHFAAAIRAPRVERAEVAGDRVALVSLGLADDVLGHRDDLAHERVALQLAALHLRELEFPLRRELRRKELGHAQAVQQRQERESLGLWERARGPRGRRNARRSVLR
jgi:hypothetical protein